MFKSEEITGIGPKSRDMLKKAGITTLAQLRKPGSVAAYVEVKKAGCNPSLNFLWGPADFCSLQNRHFRHPWRSESVLTGEHWQVVAKKHRLSLLSALEEAEKAHE